jgi:hypothetical protein
MVVMMAFVMVSTSISIFLFDMLISLNTGYYVQGKLEIDRRKIAKNYI